MRLSLARALAEAPEVWKAAASPGASAVISPTEFSGGYNTYGAGQPAQTDWDELRAVAEGYRGSTWSFACMDRLQGACSSVPWVTYEKRGRHRREWALQDDHPYSNTIERPNDFISRQQLISGMVLSICCGGNSLNKVVYVTRNRELTPDELWPMSTWHWKPVPVSEYEPIRFAKDREGILKQVQWISSYKRIDRPGTPPLEPWRVVHAQKLDPSSWIWGMSPMRPIAPILNMDRAMVAWNANLPNNMMVPSGAFVDRALKTDGQITEKARQLATRYQDPGKARVPLVLGAGTDWLPMGLTPVEVDWDSSRERNMIEVCAAFNVSPTLFIADAKYANLESGKDHLLEMGANDMLCMIEDAFNRTFVPRARRGEIYVAFDLSGVPGLKDTLPQRLDAYSKAVTYCIPPNQAAHMLDLPLDPIEGGDQPLVLGTLVPLEKLLAPDVADPLAGQEAESEGDPSAPGAPQPPAPSDKAADPAANGGKAAGGE